MLTWKRTPVVAGTLLVLVAAACSDDPQPATLSDPQAVRAELNAVDSVFDLPVFKSFDAAGRLLKGGPLAVAGAVMPQGLLAESEPSVRGALAVKELAELKVLYSVAEPQDSFLPDAVLGTYEWNPQTRRYEKTTRTGAPPNTVRIILYAIDPLTDEPAVPLNEVGYADFTDRQTVGPNRSLGVIVRNSAGTITYLDYDVTVTASPNSFGANATGFVSNGAGRRIDFSVQFLATGDDTQGSVSVDALVQVNQPNISVELHDAVTFNATTLTVNHDFRISRGGETIRVSGTVQLTQTGPDSFSITANITVRVNGGVFATITGTNNGIIVRKADGTPLTPAEQAALARILESADDFLDDLEDLFEPVEILAAF